MTDNNKKLLQAVSERLSAEEKASLTIRDLTEMFDRVSDKMIDRINDQEREIGRLESRIFELEKQKYPLRKLMIA